VVRNKNMVGNTVVRFWIRGMLAIALAVAVSESLRADGMIYQLPKDGAWVTYEFNASAKTTGGGANDSMDFRGTLSIASVGQVVVQNETCRWIEIQLATDTTGNKQGEIYKVLVPEKFLGKGQSPLSHVLQAWIQRGKEAPQKMADPNDINVGPLPIILSGPWTNPQKLDKVAIDGKLGNLQCEGVQGTIAFKMGKIGDMTCKLEERLHENSPFGVVSCAWAMELPEVEGKKAVISWNLKLIDVGTGAVTHMAEVK
jgi:hypothetical protein